MKYESVKLRQLLAAEYVLGTLVGRARQRFERLLGGDRWLRGEVRHWEQSFAELNRRLPPVAPREVVWAAIDARINATAVVTPIKPVLVTKSASTLLRAWASLATAASVVLGVLLAIEMNQPPVQLPAQIVRIEVPVPQPVAYVALLQPSKSGAQWTVSVVPAKGMMKVAASAGDYPLGSAKSLELWAIGADGKPKPLGLLPLKGHHEIKLMPGASMDGEITLAVSIEPQGGSPTGLPTGPVILTAPAVAL